MVPAGSISKIKSSACELERSCSSFRFLHKVFVHSAKTRALLPHQPLPQLFYQNSLRYVSPYFSSRSIISFFRPSFVAKSLNSSRRFSRCTTTRDSLVDTRFVPFYFQLLVRCLTHRSFFFISSFFLCRVPNSANPTEPSSPTCTCYKASLWNDKIISIVCEMISNHR